MATTEADHELKADLQELSQRMQLMAGRAEAMLAAAVRALVERDVGLARATVVDDRRVNRAEVEIDALCHRVLERSCALPPEQLRFITQSLKRVTDLERIGDLAANIAAQMDILKDEPHLDLYADISQMSEIAGEMIKDAAAAFVARDAEAARRVLARDDEADALNRKIRDALVLRMESQPRSVRAAVVLLSVAKWIERAADHGTNLAEQVIFLADGEDVRHEGKLALKANKEL